MGSYVFKLAFYGMLMLLGAVAVFLGMATGYMALSSGELTFAYDAGGRTLSSTVNRASDPSAFWRSFALACLLPVIGGALTVWYGRRGFYSL